MEGVFYKEIYCTTTRVEELSSSSLFLIFCGSSMFIYIEQQFNKYNKQRHVQFLLFSQSCFNYGDKMKEGNVLLQHNVAAASH